MDVLVFLAALKGLPPDQTRARAAQLLSRFGLADQAIPPTLKEIQAISPLKSGRTKVCLSLLAASGTSGS